MTERSENKPPFIETIIIPVPYSTWCMSQGCRVIIPKGEQALQSPSTPGFFYHLDSFKSFLKLSYQIEKRLKNT